jgi:hypothetical protein
MNLVVVGLSARDEAAFGIFLARSMNGWTWQSAPAGRAALLPQADLFVADLVSLGLAQWSELAEAELLRRLHGTPAVLLVPANDRTWATVPASTLKQRSWVCLFKPYSVENMRVALEKLAPAPIRSTRAEASAAPKRRATSTAANPKSTPSPAPAVSDQGSGLSAAELQTRLTIEPEASRYVFLRKLGNMLANERPFEARFTVHNSVIFHPSDGWAATNTPVRVIAQVCQSDALASAVTMREMDAAQAEERAHLLGMTLHELDNFLHDLWAASTNRQTSRPTTEK